MAEGMTQNGLITLPVNLAHTLQLSQLPDHHRDPFDRMLVAQAMTEPMFLLTSDRALADYGDLVRLV
jgi:PIN domain nuclease of toxin-antitoxin system